MRLCKTKLFSQGFFGYTLYKCDVYNLTEYVENNNEVDIDKIEVHNNGTVCD